MKPHGGASRVPEGRTALQDTNNSTIRAFGSTQTDPPALDAGFSRTLRAEDKSECTVKSFTEAVALLADFLAGRGHRSL
jgi:hypothetical protein